MFQFNGRTTLFNGLLLKQKVPNAVILVSMDYDDVAFRLVNTEIWKKKKNLHFSVSRFKQITQILPQICLSLW